MVTILLEQIIEILKGWLSSFTSWAEDTAEKLGLIEEATEYIDDIYDDTTAIKDNTTSIADSNIRIQGYSLIISNKTSNIDSNVTTIKNNVGSISTNTGIAAAFSEDIATNTLNTLDKVTTIASDTTQMRSNTNNIYSDVDEIKTLLRYFSAGLIMEEDSEGAIATFDTDLTDYLVNCKCRFSTIKDNNTLIGVTGINITRTGKNLFDKSMTLEAGNIQDDGSIGSVANYYHTDYIRVKASTTYTTSGTVAPASGRNAIAYYDINKNFISRYLPSSSGGHTFTTPNNTAFIRMNVYGPDVNTIQLEEGSTATAYEAYNGVTKTIDLGGDYYGGELNALNGRLKVTHGYIASYNGETINEPWLSSLDDYVPNTSPTTGAEVVYPLTTPYYVAVNDIEIKTLKGINNVYNDCDNTFVTYKETVKHYLEKQEG